MHEPSIQIDLIPTKRGASQRSRETRAMIESPRRLGLGRPLVLKAALAIMRVGMLFIASARYWAKFVQAA